MRKGKMINNQPTFEECSEWTYWKNKKTGTIVTLGLFRKYNPRKERLNVDTINTRYELTYYYSWDEIVEKFDYLGTNDDWSEEEYKSVLTNKNLYWEYKHALKSIPRAKRWVKTTDYPSLAQDRLDDLLVMKRNFERNFK
jgi:nicotinic acid mononucleotide adenylyltransferase